MTSPRRRAWRNPRIALTLFLVFLAGFSTGLAVFRLAASHWMDEAQAAPSWRDGKANLLDRFKREVNLTPEQTRQFETVLDDYFAYYHTIQAQLDDVRADGKDRMLRILNDDQKRRFEQLMNELQHQKPLR
jgi:hypothetical protein